MKASPLCWIATMASGLSVARKSEATEETSVISASVLLKQSGMSQVFSACLPQTCWRPVRSRSSLSSAWISRARRVCRGSR